MLILKALKGPMKGLTVLLAQGERVTFGRSPKCGKGALAADAAVGWRQFVIDVGPQSATLRSVGKTNSTYVNGAPCQQFSAPASRKGGSGHRLEWVLGQGDRVQAGRTVFEVSFADLDQCPAIRVAPAPASPEPRRAASDRAERVPIPFPPRATLQPEAMARERKASSSRRASTRSEAGRVGDLQVVLASGPPVVRGFTIGRLLKRGTMGGTYSARRDCDAKPVIIKVARIAAALTAAQTGDIGDCLSRLASVRHPNIVSLLDFGISTGAFPANGSAIAALCIEFCNGECLADAVNHTTGQLPPHVIYDVLEGALAALGAAHAAGVCHGNLKLQNIFLERAKGRTHPLLTDFRVPTLFQIQKEERPESISWLDRDLAPFSATPRSGAKTPVPADDLWSVAAIGQHLLGGVPPEKKKSTVISRPEAGGSDSARGAGWELQQLIGDALNNEFATAPEMAAALAALERPQVVRLRSGAGEK